MQDEFCRFKRAAPISKSALKRNGRLDQGSNSFLSHSVHQHTEQLLSVRLSMNLLNRSLIEHPNL
jgi:hypothetical protein